MDSSSQPHQSLSENETIPTSNSVNSIKKDQNKNIKKQKHSVLELSDHQNLILQDFSLLSSTALSTYAKSHGGFNVSNRIRNFRRASLLTSHNDVVGALALPTGMAIAAVLSRVLEQKDATEDWMSVDHLSKIFTSAVGESLANVFGDKYGCFVNNFEKSFRSTLMTLRLVNGSTQNNRRESLGESNKEMYCSDPTSSTNLNVEENSVCNTGEKYYRSEPVLNTINNQEKPNTFEENEVNLQPNLMNHSLILHGEHINQQLINPSKVLLPSFTNESVHNTLARSVIEQSRSNDLKTFEIGLIMKKMHLKEEQLALNSDSNSLERFKLSMGVSKASFRSEKFKAELKDARHAELLNTCIDCLVAGLLIMLAALAYGTYVYSQQRLIEATASCAPLLSTPWWMPKPVSYISSGFHTLRCQVQVVSRMLFGLLMILSIAYLLVQRSGTSKQAMPVTFILLLLGVACGFAGKFCIDTLGGSGNHWLFYWEALCLLHFLSNVCTPALFVILNGPITVSERSESSRIFPFWIRRFMFYSTTLVVLPLMCGLMPFSGPHEWRDHFSSLILNRFKMEK